MPKPSEEPPPRGRDRKDREPRSRFRADGGRRRTPGEIAKRAPYVQYWKDVQAKQRQRAHEAASSSREPKHYRIHTEETDAGPAAEERGAAMDPDESWGREPASGPWETWSDWDWYEFRWRADNRWSWRNTAPEEEAGEGHH